MTGCDLLLYLAAAGSELEEFAVTCGQRHHNPDHVSCTDLDVSRDSGSLELHA